MERDKKLNQKRGRKWRALTLVITIAIVLQNSLSWYVKLHETHLGFSIFLTSKNEPDLYYVKQYVPKTIKWLMVPKWRPHTSFHSIENIAGILLENSRYRRLWPSMNWNN